MKLMPVESNIERLFLNHNAKKHCSYSFCNQLQEMELKLNILIVCVFSSAIAELCPKQCDCDMNNGLNRATCVDQNIINVDVGVPKAVQLYVLSHNAISELENFCFKEAGYTAIKILDLSYNLIFWVGIHAFAGLDEFVRLDLSNNRLRYIPSDLFLDTPQLETLDLSANVFESLKNEPFIIHSQLQILNLNNCRIKALPERLFTRLPKLQKLDLSENYMVTLSTEVLNPLRKLIRLELYNDYWQCNPKFIAVETWIAKRGITYEKRCKKTKPKMSEKIISAVSVQREDVDVNQVWNITRDKNETLPMLEPEKKLTPLEKFDREFPALQSFVIGLEIGLAVGIVGTYVWLRKFWHCGQLNCTRPQSRRRRRRLQRMDGDMRTNLLWSNVINPDLETPPLFRRQLSLPESYLPFPAYGLPTNTGSAAIQVDAIRLPDRSETPPPPYSECRISI